MTEPDLPFTPPPEHIRKIHAQVETIKRLSDRVVGIGPFGIGLDGILAWIPGAGLVYGLGAGALLLVNAVRAKASGSTLLRMLAYLAVDNATDTVPIVGWAVDTLFPGHLMAANALQKDMVARHGPMEPPKLRMAGRSSAAPRGRSRTGMVIWLLVILGLMAGLFVLFGGEIYRDSVRTFDALKARF